MARWLVAEAGSDPLVERDNVRSRCRVVSCRVVSCRVVSCRVVSCRVVSCRVVSCRILSVVPRMVLCSWVVVPCCERQPAVTWMLFGTW